MTQRIIALLLLTLALPASAQGPVNPRKIRFRDTVPAGQSTATSKGSSGLVGGVLAAEGQFPATVGLLVPAISETPDFLTCTMTKMGPRLFVLAAHCLTEGGVQGAPLRKFFLPGAKIAIHHGVYLRKTSENEAKYQSRQTIATVEAAVPHPTWLKPEVPSDQFIDADVAWLRTAEANTPEVPTARFNTQKRSPGEAVRLQGYGCQTTHHGTTSDLHWAEATLDAVQKSMLYVREGSAEGAQVGICPGDSGGAVYLASDPANLTVVGINSRFNDGTVLGVPVGPAESFFTRLDDSGQEKVATWLKLTWQKLK
jgi:V8-like Glu-specific endopeptidase